MAKNSVNCYNTSHSSQYMQYAWPVIGHTKQRTQLEHDLATGNLAHAYIFAGPENIGKWLIAQMFATILQCPHSYCRSCTTCHAIQHNTHLDTIMIEDQNSETIKIDNIRAILGEINLRPQSAYKIILLQNIERMEQETGNALLKTLEEPPPQTLFLCTTAQLEDTLPTIRSRARIIKYNLVPEETIRTALTERFPAIDKELRSRAITFSLGRPGRALTLLNESDRLLLLQNLYTDISSFLASRSLSRILSMVREAAEEPQKAQVFLDIFEHVARDLLIAQPQESYRALQILNAIHTARRFLNGNVNPKLVLDTLVTAATHSEAVCTSNNCP